MEEVAFSAPMKEIVYENTYITKPEGYGPNTKFQRHKVREVLVHMLKERLEGQQYDPVKSSQISKMLADDLREKVKALGYERFKLIVQVTLGEKKGQAMRLVSRCLWDTDTDNYATAYYENDSLYCVCQCYGLYIE